ncbi:WD repeat-containing protein 62 [Argiope bruennichi]|uniref:WD repeat-containing protein 62 n=1 Tax=Argiope bruennichi TaxID=94029 RepID=A0A8T0FDA6_ARGBR|nr:WD repeat-containing protein 62 [Argiope bruennichi]
MENEDVTQNAAVKKVELQHVLGVTVTSNSALDSDPQTSTVAYPAGCVVVLYNTRKNKQRHLVSDAKRNITTLSFSWDGKYLVTGECGAVSHVRVWDVQKLTQVADLSGHKHGINCVAFSPNMKYVVSVGSQHDMVVNVWDWRNKQKVASISSCINVKALSFAAGGNYFVTVGNNHVKFWYLEYSRSTKISTAYSITVGENLILIGCSDGIVRCFSPLDLHFISTLPRPHYLGVDVAKGLTGRQMSSHPPGSKYPDVIAITLDETNKKVTCVHSDHSLYVWDVKDVKKVGKSHSFLYHSACIWGVETYPDLPEDNSTLPGGTFFTCASDDTIRIWNLDHKMFQNSALKRNIYCYVSTPPVYDLSYLELLCKIEAHDAEVLCLEYSNAESDPTQLLSSASRDRLVHIFDAQKNYSFAQTLDDHTSSVTAAKFVRSGNDLYFVSCGADKSVIIRKMMWKPSIKVVQEQVVTEKTTFYDMEKDASQPHVLAACQDSKIRIYDVPGGKYVRSMSGAQGEGTLIKVAMDSTGTYVATSSTDKTIYVYDYLTGQCVASMSGHSELVTGLKFMPSGKHLISVSGDGCIFVWKLTFQASKTLTKSGETISIPTSSSIWQDSRKNTVAVAAPFQSGNYPGDKKDPQSALDFSDGQLPSWAKKQISDEWKAGERSSPPPQQPRGRWAQRLEGQSLIVKSYSYTDSVIPIPQLTDVLSYRGDKVSSLEPGCLRVSISRTSVSQRSERVRHPTDSSSASSLKMDDGDAEDERSDSGTTETSELVYYPDGNADFKDSSFQINATKEEKRFLKNKQGGLQRSLSSYNVSDKGHENTDDEDSGTPGDSEPSFANSFSMSTENLEKLGLRERFMLDNFENMDKTQSEADANHRNRYSISSKYHTTSTSTPNRDFKSNTLGRRTTLMSSKKREELARALNDARKKLETLGYKGGLSSSKSVGDLSNAGDVADILEKPRVPMKESLIDMRRSTSFGDIRSGNLPRRRLPYTPQPGGAPLWEQAKTIRFEDTDNSKDASSLRNTPLTKNIKQSASSSCLSSPNTSSLRTLNNAPTPSHNESNAALPLNKSMSSLTINTSSGRERHASGGRRLSLAGMNRRLNYSDSSSSEASPTDTRSNTLVPRGIVARRMKAFCAEQLRGQQQQQQQAVVAAPTDSSKKQKLKGDREPSKSKSEWDLRKLHDDSIAARYGDKTQEYDSPISKGDQYSQLKQARAEYMNQLEASPNDLPVRDETPSVASNYLDLNTTPLTKELCEKVSDDLKKVTSFAVQLFQRVTIDSQLTTTEKAAMTTTLAQGVWQAQQNLQPTAFSARTPTSDSQTEPQAAMMLLQQYSDKLLNLIEQRITKVDK